MPQTLEVVLIIASFAFIVLAVCLMPLAFLAWRKLAQMAVTLETMKSGLDDLARDTRELVRDLDALTRRAHEEMDEVSKVVRRAEMWTERADWLASQVGLAIEPPVAAVVRKAGLLRAGVAAFLRVLAQRSAPTQTGKEQKHG